MPLKDVETSLALRNERSDKHWLGNGVAVCFVCYNASRIGKWNVGNNGDLFLMTMAGRLAERKAKAGN